MPVKTKVTTFQWQSGDSTHCWVLVNNKTTAWDGSKKYPKHHRNWHSLNKIIEQNTTEEEIWRVSECWRSWEHWDQQNALLVTKGILIYDGSWISVLIQALISFASSNGWERKICPQKYPNCEGLSLTEKQQTQAPSALYSQILNSPAGSSTWKMDELRHGCALSLWPFTVSVGERAPHRAPQGHSWP